MEQMCTMPRLLDVSDFRAVRHVLEPSDFALGGNNPDPPPCDQISKETWNTLMNLPDDVAIRTTDHFGSYIEFLHDLSSGWIYAEPDPVNPFGGALLDVYDEFTSSLFNAIHGYYKPAIASLRNVLEITVLVCDCTLQSNVQRWEDWLAGKEKVLFGNICDSLHKQSRFQSSEKYVSQKLGVSLLGNSNSQKSQCWSRDFYERLARYAHGRGNGTHAELWESTGPVFSSKGLGLVYQSTLECHALVALLIKAAWPEFKLRPETAMLFRREKLALYLPVEFDELCMHYNKELFQQNDKA